MFGVYLPSDSNTQSYVDELNLLEALTNHYSSFGDVIIGGDFNASINTKDFSHCNVYKSKILKEFITRSDLGCPNTDFKATGSKHTFITTSTSLDYIFCSKTLRSYVMDYHVFEEGVISSTSDHLPLCMELCTDVKKHILCNPLTSLPAWHKAKPDKLREYENVIRQNADYLCKTVNTFEDLDSLCIEINNVLHSAASEFIPTAKYKPYLRPEWTPQVKSLHNLERRLRKL